MHHPQSGSGSHRSDSNPDRKQHSSGQRYPPQQHPGYSSYQQAPGPYSPPGSGYPPPEYYGLPEPLMAEDPWQDRVISAFSEKQIRARFVRMVFAIVFVMLLVMVGMIALFHFQKDCKEFVQRNIWLYIIAYVVFLVVYLFVCCCPPKKFPCNVVCLVLVTITLSFMMAMISSYHDTKIVLFAGGICTLCCLTVILFACQTRFDFTSCVGVMFVVSICLILFGFIAILYWHFTGDSILFIVYAGLGALTFMMFLAIDVQLVVGGKRYELAPDEYVFAACMLFVDIVMVFFYLLQLLSGVRDRNS